MKIFLLRIVKLLLFIAIVGSGALLFFLFVVTQENSDIVLDDFDSDGIIILKTNDTLEYHAPRVKTIVSLNAAEGKTCTFIFRIAPQVDFIRKDMYISKIRMTDMWIRSQEDKHIHSEINRVDSLSFFNEDHTVSLPANSVYSVRGKYPDAFTYIFICSNNRLLLSINPRLH